MLVVTVSDRGPGIPAGQEEVIFEKFTRGARESATPGRRPRTRDQPRDRRGAPRKDPGGEQSRRRREVLVHLAAGNPAGSPAGTGRDGRRVSSGAPALRPRLPARKCGTMRRRIRPMTDNAPTALLVEDERQIRRFVRMALETEGWHVAEAETLQAGTDRRGDAQARSRDPRPRLARRQWRRLHPRIPRLVVGPDHRAFGARQRDRQDRRARCRRRRLSDQAVRRRRIARARARDAAPARPRRRQAAPACFASATSRSTRRAGSCARRARSCT